MGRFSLSVMVGALLCAAAMIATAMPMTASAAVPIDPGRATATTAMSNTTTIVGAGFATDRCSPAADPIDPGRSLASHRYGNHRGLDRAIAGAALT